MEIYDPDIVLRLKAMEIAARACPSSIFSMVYDAEEVFQWLKFGKVETSAKEVTL